MKAVRLIAWKIDPELVEVPKPTPGRGEVVVRERRLRSLRSSMDSLAGKPGKDYAGPVAARFSMSWKLKRRNTV
jgi:NADPH:quinone reductase-like Zn-dependent oxidoreductase